MNTRKISGTRCLQLWDGQGNAKWATGDNVIKRALVEEMAESGSEAEEASELVSEDWVANEIIDHTDKADSDDRVYDSSIDAGKSHFTLHVTHLVVCTNSRGMGQLRVPCLGAVNTDLSFIWHHGLTTQSLVGMSSVIQNLVEACEAKA